MPLAAAGVFFVAATAAFFLYQPGFTIQGGKGDASSSRPLVYPPLDIAAYNAKLEQIANVPLEYIRVRISS